jgi:L-ribulose-5-phosphate 4-epimerase
MLLKELRQGIVEAGVKMLRTGLVTVTWGNISAKDPVTGYIAITPSALEYDKTTPSDIVVLDAAGNVIEGKRKPSSETPMHLYIYSQRSEANAIVHTHSTYATSIGVVQGEIPILIGEVANAVGGSIKTARFGAEGTVDLGKAAIEGMRGRAAVILQNHGVVTIGRTVNDAYFNAVVVEDAARVFYIAKSLGSITTIPESEAERLHEDFLSTYGIQ